MQYLIAVALIAFAFYVITHSYGMVHLMGRADWAERYLGAGGSYTMWKIVGVLAIVLAFYMVTHPAFFGF